MDRAAFSQSATPIEIETIKGAVNRRRDHGNASVGPGPKRFLCQVVRFVMRAFGVGCPPRGLRFGGFGLRPLSQEWAALFPGIILGLVLLGLAGAGPSPPGDTSRGVSGVVLAAVVAGMVLSPFTGSLPSRPIGQVALAGAGHGGGAGGRAGIGSRPHGLRRRRRRGARAAGASAGVPYERSGIPRAIN